VGQKLLCTKDKAASFLLFLFACSACRALTPLLLLLLLLLPKSGSSIATTDHLRDLRAQISLSTQSVDVRPFSLMLKDIYSSIDPSVSVFNSDVLIAITNFTGEKEALLLSLIRL
jgi:hypothetical protein